MRKILLLLFIALAINLNAQSEKMIEKAKSNAGYVAKAMKLSDADQQFLYDALLNSYVEGATRKKGLTQEEKKEVGKEVRSELKEELSKNFSKEQIKEIFALIKEKREKDKAQAQEK